MKTGLLRATLCWGAFAVSSASAAVTIDKVVPVASDHDVRVRVSVKSDQAGPVALEGKIVPAAGGASLWEGSLGTASVQGGGGAAEQTVGDLKPELWSPGSPKLYNLVVTARQGGAAESQSVRFGFRSFTTADGHFLLNGHPVFMRGIAINPPGRDIPDDVGYSKEFAYAYVQYLRSQHVNLIRMTFEFKPDPRQQVWFDACDELGMMVDQGNYGTPPGSIKGKSVDPEEQTNVFEGRDPNVPKASRSGPPTDFAKAAATYKETFETYQRHPSVVIYVLSNEQPGPNRSKPEWHEFLSKMSDEIHAWDPTRRIIGNAGYGWGREGDVADLHRYWGWYYNSFLTYYNLRDTVGMFGQETDKQPFTFSECVGSFTSPLGNFNAIFRKQLAPQLGWTGHSGDQTDDSLAYQAFMVKHALESFRTLREQNPRMSGLMPFTILFFNWEGIRSFDQMKPKPAMEQMGVSYSPVLTSIELWTSQVYAGKPIHPVIHVVNDAEDFSDLANAKLVLTLTPKEGGQPQLTKSIGLPKLAYFEAHPFPTTLDLPASLPTDDYVLSATVEKDGKTISQNHESLYVSQPHKATQSPTGLAIYDPNGATTKALGTLGIQAQPVRDLSTAPKEKALIIGEEAFRSATPLSALKQYVASGGRVLVLAQDADRFDTSWLPSKVEMLTGTATDPTYTPKVRPTADQQNVNPERPWHPVFANGITRERLRLWSDYTGWDQSKKGFPKVYPVTHGFKLIRAEDLAHTAILADYEHGLEACALVEMFDGQGSVLLTGLDLTPRVGLDPIADQVLSNLVTYLTSADSREILPVIDQPIVWGNYATERGVLTGPLQGLVYNCRWVAPPTAPNAKPMADNTGAWNTHPGNPFVTIGVRPLGPYSWSTGASPREDSKDAEGTGVFYARVPGGRTFVVSKVENPGKTSAKLDVIVNDQTPAAGGMISPGQSVTIRTPIPAGATDLSVRYTGNKSIVILETSFE